MLDRMKKDFIASKLNSTNSFIPFIFAEKIASGIFEKLGSLNIKK